MALQAQWTHAPHGRLPPKEQAKLWALREVLRKQGEDCNQFQWMSTQVHVKGGGSPCREAVRRFFERVDEDPAGWYPGRSEGKSGRPQALTPLKRKTVAKSMMAAKKRGLNPSYELALDLCPKATTNEQTQQAFCRKSINEVLTTECYDETPERPWEFRFGAKRRAVSAEDREDRKAWAKRLMAENRQLNRSATWFLQNIIWLDICSKVIPGSPAKALDQHNAAENKRKRLMSRGASSLSQNLGGSSTADKQCGFGDTRVYFGACLCRGVFGVVVFSEADGFPGETPIGACMLVAKLRGLLRKMLGSGALLPRTIFTDRGPGFFHRSWGTITGDYESACKEHGFKPWQGSNAKQGPHAQPRDIPDVLLHETAISWLRRGEEGTRPKKPWEETPKEFAARLQKVAKSVNENYNVRDLALEFPDRLHALVRKTCGDRLQK